MVHIDRPGSQTYTETAFAAFLASPTAINEFTRGVHILVVDDVDGSFRGLFVKSEYGPSPLSIRAIQVGERPASTYRIPLATRETASGAAQVAIGWGDYDPALFDLSGLTVVMRLRFRAAVSAVGVMAEVKLWDLRTGLAVATLNPNTHTRSPPAAYDSALFNANADETCYELRARITNDAGDPAAYVDVGGAALEIVTWT